MRLSARFIAIATFSAAALLAGTVSVFAVKAIESRSARAIDRLLAEAGFDWADVAADGMLVTLTGTAPNESTRFEALTIAGSVVDAAQVIDAMEVTPGVELTAPRFSLELLRNDDGISLIGLVPASYEHAGMVEQVVRLTGDEGVADMLETADFPVPESWDSAVGFGFEALKTLPRSKISISAGRVEVIAISESADQRRQFEADLLARVPEDVSVQLEISAPRPVITPFTLRFVIDENGPRFDACSAESERTRARILTAAVTAGLPRGGGRCTIGLGVPSPRWADAAVLGIDALAELGRGSVTFSDADVTLTATPEVGQDDFDRVVGELTAALPDVFSLRAVLETAETTPRDQGPPRFTAALGPDGQVQLRGRLTDGMQRDAVDAYARARFGAEAVYTATRFDETLPEGWAVRVLAGLSALAELRDGSLLVEAGRVEVRGVSGSQETRDAISRILSERLGQGARFSIDVTYDETLDPVAALPTPEECVISANTVLAGGQVTFAPGSAEIDAGGQRTLVALADVLRDCMDVPLEIGGHTDSQGRAETNLRLSQDRADSVLRALMGLRVPVGSFSARGYGPTRPVADNATEAGREANRRIEFRLIGPEAAAEADEAVALDETGAEVVPVNEGPPPARPRARPEGLAADVAGDEETGTQDDAPLPEARPEPRPEDPGDDLAGGAAEGAGAAVAGPETPAEEPAPEAAGEEPETDAADMAEEPAPAPDAAEADEVGADGAGAGNEAAAEARDEAGNGLETEILPGEDPAASVGAAGVGEENPGDAGSGDDSAARAPYDSAAPREMTLRPQRRPGTD